MIIDKFVTGIRAIFNSLANALWARNPVAVLQLKIDEATAEILGARKGVEQYAGLVEGIKRQVAALTGQDAQLDAQIKAHLKAATASAPHNSCCSCRACAHSSNRSGRS